MDENSLGSTRSITISAAVGHVDFKAQPKLMIFVAMIARHKGLVRVSVKHLAASAENQTAVFPMA